MNNPTPFALLPEQSGEQLRAVYNTPEDITRHCHYGATPTFICISVSQDGSISVASAYDDHGNLQQPLAWDTTPGAVQQAMQHAANAAKIAGDDRLHRAICARHPLVNPFSHFIRGITILCHKSNGGRGVLLTREEYAQRHHALQETAQ